MRTKALFFAPHSYIWSHAYPEALVAEALESQDIEVHYITCGRALDSWCVAMESTGAMENISDLDKNKICLKCEKNKNDLLGHFNFSNSSLASYLTSSDSLTIDSLLKNIKRQDLFEFTIDDINIGRASLYNFTINRKKSFKSEFSDEEWGDFLKHFKSCLISYYAGKNILKKLSPDKLFFYSSSYSINLVVRLQAEKLGISCFSLYAGLNWANRFQKMHISRIDSFSAYNSWLERWSECYRNFPATANGLGSALAKQKTLLAGNHSMIYGGGNAQISPEIIRQSWGIPEESKVLFVASSSYDEVLAAQVIKAIPENQVMAFSSQIEWIKQTIDFVSQREEFTLIIRVHPRDFPNKRESIGSEHSLQLKKLFRNLPDNIKINWPEDGMSLYDWLEIIDLGLTSWSSAGKEFALWGIPNLSYSEELTYYPKRDLGFVGLTPGEYFEGIDKALDAGWNKQHLLMAYRWSAFELDGLVFDLSDVIPKSFANPSSFIWKVLNRLTGRKFQERKWFWYHRSPVKHASLMARKVLTGKPTVDILEPEIERLTEIEEVNQIRP